MAGIPIASTALETTDRTTICQSVTDPDTTTTAVSMARRRRIALSQIRITRPPSRSTITPAYRPMMIAGTTRSPVAAPTQICDAPSSRINQDCAMMRSSTPFRLAKLLSSRARKGWFASSLTAGIWRSLVKCVGVYALRASSDPMICGAASIARSRICSGVRLPIGCWISANG